MMGGGDRGGTLEGVVQGLAGDLLDERAKHVGRVAVFPGGSGPIGERQPRDAADEPGAGQARIAVDRGLVVRLLHQRLAEDPAGEARRVPEQVLRAHLSLRRDLLQHVGARGVLPLEPDLWPLARAGTWRPGRRGRTSLPRRASGPPPRRRLRAPSRQGTEARPATRTAATDADANSRDRRMPDSRIRARARAENPERGARYERVGHGGAEGVRASPLRERCLLHSKRGRSRDGPGLPWSIHDARRLDADQAGEARQTQMARCVPSGHL